MKNILKLEEQVSNEMQRYETIFEQINILNSEVDEIRERRESLKPQVDNGIDYVERRIATLKKRFLDCDNKNLEKKSKLEKELISLDEAVMIFYNYFNDSYL